ncbi:MAG: protein translocase subunit SecD [Actinomycetota bacterium]
MASKQKYLLSMGFALILVAVCIYFIVKYPPKLGLDLKGGMHIILSAKEKPGAPVTEQSMEQALFVIRQRVDKLGVTEPQIERQGRNSILVQLPGIRNPQKALEIIGKTALLEFIEVKSIDKEGKVILGKVLMTGKALKNARPSFGEMSKPIVEMEFTKKGTKKFADITTRYVRQRLAIVLDKEVMSAPVIQEPITGGRAIITGLDSIDEAKRIALVLQTGALPVELDISESKTVGPTLGWDSLMAGLRAGILGLILVALFMVIYYRLFGVITWLALGVFATFLFGLLVAVNAVLTSFGLAGINLSLPSIAGIVLMIGVAADSSIIVFERIKEEVRGGKTIRTALDTGFSHGFKTFLDADLVTFTTAAILFYFGIGPVRGFALTLMLGIVCDLFTSFFFTRAMLGLMSFTKLWRNPKLLGLERKG